MALSSTARRRILGSLFLLTALAMLILGQTVLWDRLVGVDFVFYWMACVIMTGLAVLTAILDFRALVQRSYKEQHDLLVSAIQDIEKDAGATRRQGRQGEKRRPSGRR